MEDPEFIIRPCELSSQGEWLAMRVALWPDGSEEDHQREMTALLEQPDRYCQFVAYDGGGTPAGFVELCLRQDHVNGTSSSPVAFVEGIHTVQGMRRKGVAAMLMKKAEEWAREKGCSELASDALAENTVSHEVHRALGFEETERVVYFRKALQG
jgi:aminoglycoside 6'-N-acetyltransferase I